MRQDEKNICRIYTRKTVKRYKEKRSKAFFNEQLVNPKFRETILRLGITGKKIIDIGCGYGADLEYLLNQGAGDLTGTDINRHFLDEIKKNQYLYKRIKTHKQSIYALKLPQKFDLAYSNMVLDQVEDLDAAFSKVAGLLNDKGYYIFSMMHPLNTATKDYKETLTDYFCKKAKIVHPKTIGKDLFSYQRTFEDISKALRRNRFLIHSLQEPRPLENDRSRSGKWSIYQNLPGVLIVCAQLIK